MTRLLLIMLLLATPVVAGDDDSYWSNPKMWGLDMQAGLSRNEDADDDSVFAKLTFAMPSWSASIEAREEDYSQWTRFCGNCYRQSPADGMRVRVEAAYLAWANHGPVVAFENEPNRDDRWEVGWRMRIGPMN